MRVLDLFSGIGGFSLAAHWAGMETAAFCEIETFCQKVLRKNFPGVPIYDDVRSVTKEQLERDGVINGDRTIELVCGGFPCQPFSVAGKQRGKEDDRHLWPEMFRIIKELRPAWVVGENVTGLIKLALDDVIADLESEGYTVRAFIIPAAAVGAPHRRDRVWIVGDSNRQRCNSGSSDWQERQVHNYKERDYQKTCANRKQLQSQPWPNGKTLANTDGAGQQKCNVTSIAERAGFSTRSIDPRRGERPAQSRLGRNFDGLSTILDGDRGGDGLDRDRVILGALREGAIEVNFETGKIYSRRIRGKEGQLVELKGSICNGYIVHNIHFKGVKKQVRAHRVVWMAANGPIPEGMMIDHINRNRTDNRLSNLRLVNAKENAQNRPSVALENNPASRLSLLEAQIIKNLYFSGEGSIRQLADKFGISKSQVHNIVTGKAWGEAHLWPAGLGQTQYEWEPPRVTEGVKRRKDRLKALGNAIVPQVAYQIFKAIMEVEKHELASRIHTN